MSHLYNLQREIVLLTNVRCMEQLERTQILMAKCTD